MGKKKGGDLSIGITIKWKTTPILKGEGNKGGYFCDFSRCKLLYVDHPTDDMQMDGKFGTGNSVGLLRGDNAYCNSNSFNLSREQLTPFYQ